MTFEPLERPFGTLDLLYLLWKRRRADVSTLLAELAMPRESFYGAVRRLEQLGLVFQHREKGWPVHVYLELTTKGAETVSALEPLADFLRRSAVALDEERSRLTADPSARGRLIEVLTRLYDLYFERGLWDKALACAKDGLHAASAIPDGRAVAEAHLRLGAVLLRRADPSCEAHLTAALDALHDLDACRASDAAYLLASLREEKRRPDEAATLLELAIELGTRVSDPVRVGRAQIGFARILAKRGMHSEAYERLQAARVRLEGAGAKEEYPRLYTNLGATAFRRDPGEALGWHDRCVDAAERLCDVRMIAYGHSNAAGCLIRLGQPARALDRLEAAREIAKLLQEKRLLVGIAIQSADASRAMRRWKAARTFAEEAVAVARGAGLQYELADALYLAGSIEKRRGESRRAREFLRESLRLFQELGNRDKQAKVRAELRAA